MTYLIVTALVLLSGIFSGLTLGLFSLNLSGLERKMKLGDPRARRIFPVRRRGNLLLCTLLLGNVAVNSALAIFLGEIATGLVAGLVSTGLIVVFGEILPQAVFARHALAVGANTVWLVRVFMIVLYPIAGPLAYVLDRVLGQELATIWSKKEIKEIIKAHEDSPDSAIDADEERILLGALTFSERTAAQIMTPASVAYVLQAHQPLDAALLKEIREKGYTRIPVFQQGKPLGLLHSKDLIGLSQDQSKPVLTYARMDPLITVKQEIKLDTLLNIFVQQKRHLALVHDNFGTFTGIVTLEDVIEDIIRVEIVDEMDVTVDLQLKAKEDQSLDLLE